MQTANNVSAFGGKPVMRRLTLCDSAMLAGVHDVQQPGKLHQLQPRAFWTYLQYTSVLNTLLLKPDGMLLTSLAVYCINDRFGGMWALVRHAPQGTTWHPATYVNCICHPYVTWIMTDYSDALTGTAAYGTYQSNPQAPTAFSVPFTPSSSTKMLFMTGDGQYWGITSYGTISQATSSSGTAFTWQSSSASSRLSIGINT